MWAALSATGPTPYRGEVYDDEPVRLVAVRRPARRSERPARDAAERGTGEHEPAEHPPVPERGNLGVLLRPGRRGHDKRMRRNHSRPGQRHLHRRSRLRVDVRGPAVHSKFRYGRRQDHRIPGIERLAGIRSRAGTPEATAGSCPATTRASRRCRRESPSKAGSTTRSTAAVRRWTSAAALTWSTQQPLRRDDPHRAGHQQQPCLHPPAGHVRSPEPDHLQRGDAAPATPSTAARTCATRAGSPSRWNSPPPPGLSTSTGPRPRASPGPRPG